MSDEGTPATASNAYNEIVVTRTFQAPREPVYSAWTDAEKVAKWWGPASFTTTVPQWDVRPGGLLRIEITSPDGMTHPMIGTFREVDPPRQLVYAFVVVAADGAKLFECQQSMTLEEADGLMTLTLRAEVLSAVPEAAQYLKYMEAGLIQTLDGLARFVTSATAT